MSRNPKRVTASPLRNFLIVVGIVIAGFFIITRLCVPFFISGGGNADTRPLPGDAARFYPLAELDAIQEYAGANAELISIDAYYVRSDGSIDLTVTSYYPYVNYQFVRELDEPPADAPPVGAGGSTSGTWYEPVEIRAYQPGQWRRVSGSSLSYTYMNQGMQREVDSPRATLPSPIVPLPACSYGDLWDVALAQDAPAEAVAIIEYDANGYTFSISDVSLRLQFDLNCALRD